MLELFSRPWPWYVAGPLIGLMVPALLLLGNRSFGMSSNLRHLCAACVPTKVPYFDYDWRAERWSLLVALGLVAGAAFASYVLPTGKPVAIHPELVRELAGYGIAQSDTLIPDSVLSFGALSTLQGCVSMILGGFLVGFGTRYAGGCTSGHSIYGLSTLQLPSLVATASFMVGGFLMSNLVLPTLLR